MPFAAIYVPDFPVEALVRAEPELRERALAVVEGTPPLLMVVGVNERARQCGVELGMTALQAEERLAQPGAAVPHKQALIRRRSPAQEQAAHAALLDSACAFSPRVEDTAADTVLLDAAGLERLFGPPAKLAREVARRVSEVGMEANVAIAANPDAAMHAARGFLGVTVIPIGKEAERLGELPVDVLFSAKGAPPLSLPVLERQGGMLELLETLDRWGVRHLRALAALPEVAVTQRLGQEGLRLQRLARGEGSRPLRVAEPPLKFEEAIELEYPIALLEPLAFLMNRMLEQLCARLAARALAAQELRLQLELDQAEDPENPPQRRRDAEDFKTNRGFSRIHTDSIKNQKSEIGNQNSSAPLRLCGKFTRAIKLPVPLLDAKVFLKLLQLDLQAHPPGAPVMKVWLEAKPAEPRRAQSGLFVPVTPEPEKLELTLARIKAVVSRRSPVASEPRVGSPEVLDTHRPDAFRMRSFDPFSVAGDGKTQGSFAPLRTSSSTRTPESGVLAQDDNPRLSAVPSPIANRQLPIAAMRILRPPLPILVEMRDGVPAKLTVNDSVFKSAERSSAQSSIFNHQSSIEWAAGPWRTSGDWWDQQAWAREEWDIAVKNADAVALYRIYRDERRGAWFIEAEYD